MLWLKKFDIKLDWNGFDLRDFLILDDNSSSNPVDDGNAKWRMENLFVEDLEPPLWTKMCVCFR